MTYSNPYLAVIRVCVAVTALITLYEYWCT